MSNNFLTAHPFLSIAVATFGFGAIQVAFVYFIVEKDNKKRHSELLHEISYLNNEILSIKEEIIQLNKQLFKNKKNVTFYEDLNENTTKRNTCSSSSSIISDTLYLDASEKDFIIDHNINKSDHILETICVANVGKIFILDKNPTTFTYKSKKTNLFEK